MDDILPVTPWRDALYACFLCKCGDELRLEGHSAQYFMESAAKTLHECPKCGKVITYKWTRAGVCIWEGDRT